MSNPLAASIGNGKSDDSDILYIYNPVLGYAQVLIQQTFLANVISKGGVSNLNN